MTLDTLVELDPLQSLDNTSHAPFLVMDNSTQPLFRLVQAINLYLIPVISGVGLLGGVASFLVFVFTTFQYQPCAQYLAVLTASDAGFLIALLMAWLTTLRPEMAANPGYCQVMVYMTYTCSFLSAWYLVLLMLERYITVCHPLRAPVLCTRRHARLAIGTVTLLALLIYSHSFFTTGWRSSSVDSPCRQKEQHLQFLTIFTYLDFLVTFALPFLLVLVLNLRIILAVRSFRRRHQPLRPAPSGAEERSSDTQTTPLPLSPPGPHLSTPTPTPSPPPPPSAPPSSARGVQYTLMSRAQVRATKLLVWVASVFLVLYLPSHALRLYLLIRVLTEGRVYSEQLMLAQQICQFIYYINFAVDFFVFSVTSKSFRRNIARCLKRL